MNNTIAIIQFPGSNTERETFLACKRSNILAKAFLWNEPLRNFLTLVAIL